MLQTSHTGHPIESKWAFRPEVYKKSRQTVHNTPHATSKPKQLTKCVSGAQGLYTRSSVHKSHTITVRWPHL